MQVMAFYYIRPGLPRKKHPPSVCKKRETSLFILQDRKDDDEGVLIKPPYTVLASPTSLSPTEFRPLQGQPNIDFCSCSVEVVGSCRGVVCLVVSGRCILWNPTTGESRALPIPDHYGYFLGIGHYDSDFKVVQISMGSNSSNEPTQVRAHIYELSLDSWREISPIGISNYDNGLPSSVDSYMACWRDGKMCSWIVVHLNDGCENSKFECSIVSFDMTNETFTNFSCAPVPLFSDGIGLLALNDLLALWYRYWDEITMDIWVLLHHGVVESWTKLWTIQVEPEPLWPMVIWNGGLVMIRCCDDRLLWCGLSNSSWVIQTLPEFASPSCSWRKTSTMVAFKKTYASLDLDRWRDVQFEVGDFVWAVLTKDRFPAHEYNKLSSRKIGPVKVVEKIYPNAYRLRLPCHIRTSDVFHVKHLVPFTGDDSSEDEATFDSKGKSCRRGKNDGDEAALLYLDKHDRSLCWKTFI